MNDDTAVITLRNSDQKPCALVRCFPVTSVRQALEVVWSDSVTGEPDRAQALGALRRLVEDSRMRCLQTIETRVITDQAGADAASLASRAQWLRSIVHDLGFEHATTRVEYRLPLEDAIARLEARAPQPRLAWLAIVTEPGLYIERAARVLRSVSEGAPTSAVNADPLGFLLSRREDRDLVLPADSLQIGMLDDRDVALVAPNIVTATGWCSLHYLGVIPAWRGQHVGTEAMLHGLRTMRTLGGLTYHDGTDARSDAMIALFGRLGAPRFRLLEEWELLL
jgi:hypothetical protein